MNTPTIFNTTSQSSRPLPVVVEITNIYTKALTCAHRTCDCQVRIAYVTTQECALEVHLFQAPYCIQNMLGLDVGTGVYTADCFASDNGNIIQGDQILQWTNNLYVAIDSACGYVASGSVDVHVQCDFNRQLLIHGIEDDRINLFNDTVEQMKHKHGSQQYIALQKRINALTLKIKAHDLFEEQKHAEILKIHHSSKLQYKPQEQQPFLHTAASILEKQRLKINEQQLQKRAQADAIIEKFIQEDQPMSEQYTYGRYIYQIAPLQNPNLKVKAPKVTTRLAKEQVTAPSTKEQNVKQAERAERIEHQRQETEELPPDTEYNVLRQVIKTDLDRKKEYQAALDEKQRFNERENIRIAELEKRKQQAHLESIMTWRKDRTLQPRRAKSQLVELHEQGVYMYKNVIYTAYELMSKYDNIKMAHGQIKKINGIKVQYFAKEQRCKQVISQITNSTYHKLYATQYKQKGYPVEAARSAKVIAEKGALKYDGFCHYRYVVEYLHGFPEIKATQNWSTAKVRQYLRKNAPVALAEMSSKKNKGTYQYLAQKYGLGYLDYDGGWLWPSIHNYVAMEDHIFYYKHEGAPAISDVNFYVGADRVHKRTDAKAKFPASISKYVQRKPELSEATSKAIQEKRDKNNSRAANQKERIEAQNAQHNENCTALFNAKPSMCDVPNDVWNNSFGATRFCISRLTKPKPTYINASDPFDQDYIRMPGHKDGCFDIMKYIYKYKVHVDDIEGATPATIELFYNTMVAEDKATGKAYATSIEQKKFFDDEKIDYIEYDFQYNNNFVEPRKPDATDIIEFRMDDAISDITAFHFPSVMIYGRHVYIQRSYVERRSQTVAVPTRKLSVDDDASVGGNNNEGITGSDQSDKIEELKLDDDLVFISNIVKHAGKHTLVFCGYGYYDMILKASGTTRVGYVMADVRQKTYAYTQTRLDEFEAFDFEALLPDDVLVSCNYKLTIQQLDQLSEKRVKILEYHLTIQTKHDADMKMIDRTQTQAVWSEYGVHFSVPSVHSDSQHHHVRTERGSSYIYTMQNPHRTNHIEIITYKVRRAPETLQDTASIEQNLSESVVLTFSRNQQDALRPQITVTAPIKWVCKARAVIIQSDNSKVMSTQKIAALFSILRNQYLGGSREEIYGIVPRETEKMLMDALTIALSQYKIDIKNQADTYLASDQAGEEVKVNDLVRLVTNACDLLGVDRLIKSTLVDLVEHKDNVGGTLLKQGVALTNAIVRNGGCMNYLKNLQDAKEDSPRISSTAKFIRHQVISAKQSFSNIIQSVTGYQYGSALVGFTNAWKSMGARYTKVKQGVTKKAVVMAIRLRQCKTPADKVKEVAIQIGSLVSNKPLHEVTTSMAVALRKKDQIVYKVRSKKDELVLQICNETKHIARKIVQATTWLSDKDIEDLQKLKQATDAADQECLKFIGSVTVRWNNAEILSGLHYRSNLSPQKAETFDEQAKYYSLQEIASGHLFKFGMGKTEHRELKATRMKYGVFKKKVTKQQILEEKTKNIYDRLPKPFLESQQSKREKETRLDALRGSAPFNQHVIITVNDINNRNKRLIPDVQFFDKQGVEMDAKQVIEFAQDNCTCDTKSMIRERFRYAHLPLGSQCSQFATCPVNVLGGLFQRHSKTKLMPNKAVLHDFIKFCDRKINKLKWNTELDGITRWQDYYQHVYDVDPKKALLYAAAREQAIREEKMISEYQIITKVGEMFIDSEGKKGNNRPRLLYPPHMCVRAICGHAAYVLSKQAKLWFPQFVSGLKPEELDSVINTAIRDSSDFNCYSIDGSSHDSHQHDELIKAIDVKVFDKFYQNIFKLLELPESMREMVRRICTTVVIKAKAYHGNTRKTFVKASVQGTVYSGHPLRTTLGNTMRVILYTKYVLQGLRAYFYVAGDDILLYVHKNDDKHFQENFWSVYSKDTTGCHGLGQCCRKLILLPKGYADFLSRIQSLHVPVATRNVARMVTTQAFTVSTQDVDLQAQYDVSLAPSVQHIAQFEFIRKRFTTTQQSQLKVKQYLNDRQDVHDNECVAYGDLVSTVGDSASGCCPGQVNLMIEQLNSRDCVQATYKFGKSKAFVKDFAVKKSDELKHNAIIRQHLRTCCRKQQFKHKEMNDYIQSQHIQTPMESKQQQQQPNKGQQFRRNPKWRTFDKPQTSNVGSAKLDAVERQVDELKQMLQSQGVKTDIQSLLKGYSEQNESVLTAEQKLREFTNPYYGQTTQQSGMTYKQRQAASQPFFDAIMQIDNAKLAKTGDVMSRDTYMKQLAQAGIDPSVVSYSVFRELVALDWWGQAAQFAIKWGPAVWEAIKAAIEIYRKISPQQTDPAVLGEVISGKLQELSRNQEQDLPAQKTAFIGKKNFQQGLQDMRMGIRRPGQDEGYKQHDYEESYDQPYMRINKVGVNKVVDSIESTIGTLNDPDSVNGSSVACWICPSQVAARVPMSIPRRTALQSYSQVVQLTVNATGNGGLLINPMWTFIATGRSAADFDPATGNGTIGYTPNNTFIASLPTSYKINSMSVRFVTSLSQNNNGTIELCCYDQQTPPISRDVMSSQITYISANAYSTPRMILPLLTYGDSLSVINDQTVGFYLLATGFSPVAQSIGNIVVDYVYEFVPSNTQKAITQQDFSASTYETNQYIKSLPSKFPILLNLDLQQAEKLAAKIMINDSWGYGQLNKTIQQSLQGYSSSVVQAVSSFTDTITANDGGEFNVIDM